MKIFMFDALHNLNHNFTTQYIGRLPLDRQEKCNRYLHESDKKLCIVTYLLLCYGLEQRYGLEQTYGIEQTVGLRDKIEFTYNAYGKPALKDYPEIFFNFSHTQGLAICALGDAELGVDCEKITTRDDKVARHMCSKKEYKDILLAKNPDLAFFKLWTLKESYIKAVGEGLNLELNRITFDVVNKVNSYQYGGYDFNDFTYKKAYCISACGHHFQEQIEVEIVGISELLKVLIR